VNNYLRSHWKSAVAAQAVRAATKNHRPLARRRASTPAAGPTSIAAATPLPTDKQSLLLAMRDTTLAFVDAYIKPAHASTDDLIRVEQHGVGPEYVQSLAAAGYSIVKVGTQP